MVLNSQVRVSILKCELNNKLMNCTALFPEVGKARLVHMFSHLDAVFGIAQRNVLLKIPEKIFRERL